MVPSYTNEKGLLLLVREDLCDIGDVDSMEAGGVGIDNDSDRLVDAAGMIDLEGLGATLLLWPEAVDAIDESFWPHEARTLFSTLTVSSRNIKDSWSRYPGQALDSRTHCVHSGCLLSHYSLAVSSCTLERAANTLWQGMNAAVSWKKASWATCYWASLSPDSFPGTKRSGPSEDIPVDHGSSDPHRMSLGLVKSLVGSTLPGTFCNQTTMQIKGSDASIPSLPESW